MYMVLGWYSGYFCSKVPLNGPDMSFFRFLLYEVLRNFPLGVLLHICTSNVYDLVGLVFCLLRSIL